MSLWHFRVNQFRFDSNPLKILFETKHVLNHYPPIFSFLREIKLLNLKFIISIEFCFFFIYDNKFFTEISFDMLIEN